MLSSSAQRQLSEFVYPFATNSDRGGLTDVKSIALPQLSNADSAEAVEVEAKRSVMRPYPTGSRGREMSGNDHDRAIGEGLEEAPPSTQAFGDPLGSRGTTTVQVRFEQPEPSLVGPRRRDETTARKVCSGNPR